MSRILRFFERGEEDASKESLNMTTFIKYFESALRQQTFKHTSAQYMQ